MCRRVRVGLLSVAMLLAGCRMPFSAPGQSALAPVNEQALPATVVAQRLQRLLTAYNANDSVALVRVITENYSPALRGQNPPEVTALRWLETYPSYGPLAVDSVTVSTPLTLRLWARGTVTRAWMEFLVASDTVAPHFLTRVTTGRGLKPPFQRAVARVGSEVAAIAEYVDQLAAHGNFSGVVLIAKDGVTVLERRHGFANVAARTPHTLDTRFSLASAGKLFTATAVAMLVQQRRLQLSDTIGRYLSELPPQVANRVTVGQLLTHTSGLGELGPRFDTLSFTRARDYIPFFRDTTLAFAPGTSWEYSNRGYVVLGAIVEAVTGLSFEKFLSQSILRPLGMRRTTFLSPTQLEPGDAIGYTRYPTIRGGFVSGPRRPNTPIMERGSPAGGIYSSAADLLRFAEALRTNRLGGAAPSDSIFSMTTAEEYGLMVSPDKLAFGHGGGHPGVSANVQVFPLTGYSVVLLSNYDVVTNHIAAFAQDVLR